MPIASPASLELLPSSVCCQWVRRSIPSASAPPAIDPVGLSSASARSRGRLLLLLRLPSPASCGFCCFDAAVSPLPIDDPIEAQLLRLSSPATSPALLPLSCCAPVPAAPLSLLPLPCYAAAVPGRCCPSPAIGFRSSEEEHSTSSVDLKKKRKLQYELGILDMPSTKHRITVGANILEEPSIRETHNDLEPCLEESENDNSFIGAYDNSMASDVKVLDEYSITLTSNHDLEETLQYDPGYKVAEEIYPVFGLDHAILELESEDNAETESMILYTNDVAPHSFMRSSGCWNLGQDVPLGAKKPTIDKEFEQYFSSLML